MLVLDLMALYFDGIFCLQAQPKQKQQPYLVQISGELVCGKNSPNRHKLNTKMSLKNQFNGNGLLILKLIC